MSNESSIIRKQIHIIGVGNLTRLDDGVAIKIIQELEKEQFPSNVKISDLGTGGMDITLSIEGFSQVIIIDAVDIAHLEAGNIIEFTVTEKNLPTVKGFSSTHGFDVISALKLAYTLKTENLPENITIIGIQVKRITGIGLELSKEVQTAIPKVIARVKELIQKFS